MKPLRPCMHADSAEVDCRGCCKMASQRQRGFCRWQVVHLCRSLKCAASSSWPWGGHTPWQCATQESCWPGAATKTGCWASGEGITAMLPPQPLCQTSSVIRLGWKCCELPLPPWPTLHRCYSSMPGHEVSPLISLGCPRQHPMQIICCHLTAHERDPMAFMSK